MKNFSPNQFLALLAVVLILGSAVLFVDKMDQRNMDMITIFGGIGLLGCLLIIGIGAVYLLYLYAPRPKEIRRRRRRRPPQLDYDVETEARPVAPPSRQIEDAGSWETTNKVKVIDYSDWQ